MIRNAMRCKNRDEQFYIHEEIATRNCPRKFVKNLLPEKRKENM